MSTAELRPTTVVVDGLNVMGRASNHWSMDAWFGLIQVLMILRSVSSRVFGGIEVITVIREHGAFEKDYVSERLEQVSRLSRLILLSERSGREDDDFLVMSLSKLHNGYFVSHDLSIQKHIGEDERWSKERRILIQLDPVTRGILLEIPRGEVKDGYDKLAIYDHLQSLLNTDRDNEPEDDAADQQPEEAFDDVEESNQSHIGKVNCTYCDAEVSTMERAREHTRNTGHNHYRGWSLPPGGITLEGFE